MTDEERYGIAVIALETADASEAVKLIAREFSHVPLEAILSILDEHESFLRSQGLGDFKALRAELARLRRPRRVISVGQDNPD